MDITRLHAASAITADNNLFIPLTSILICLSTILLIILCTGHKGRDQITCECWRLRRLEDPEKKALDQTPKAKIYRSSKLKCPKCHYKFQAKDGVMD